MKRRFLLALGGLIVSAVCRAQVTLDYCISKADSNYPLIRKYGLVERTNSIILSDINKLWLPSVNAYAQAIIQNAVPEFPSTLTDIMAQMGRKMRGLGKSQYKVGVEISQTIWDGGASKAKRKTARSGMLEQEAYLDVEVYAMHERVMTLYFAALLTSRQMEQQLASISILESNLRKMEAMFLDGTAMRSDVDNVKAQLLSAQQKHTEAGYLLDSYRKALEIFMGESIEGKDLEKPADNLPIRSDCRRPELKLFEMQKNANNSKISEINASVMPKFGLFAQAFYGYPGYNNFESMMKRDLSFNVLAGVRASWSLSPIYTKSSSLQKINLSNQTIEAERETFLFNNDISLAGKQKEIEGLRKVLSDDSEIIKLRTDVRKAAEVRLENGVIDTFTLLAKINDETQAKISAAYHEIKLLNAIYQLRYLTNQ